MDDSVARLVEMAPIPISPRLSSLDRAFAYRYLASGISLAPGATRRTVDQRSLAARVEGLAALSDDDLDAAICEAERIIAGLPARRQDALEFTERQADVIGGVVEAALAGLELPTEKVELGRQLAVAALRKVTAEQAEPAR